MFNKISLINDFPFIDKLKNKWMLISSGDKNKYNMMTANWGGFGYLWNIEVAFIFIRPSRYTYSIVDASKHFSLNFFSDKYKQQLDFCGKYSGKTVNKVKETGLTSIFNDNYIYFNEAELILNCSTIYFDDIQPKHFLTEAIMDNYSSDNFHRMFIGKIDEVLQKQKG